MRAVQGVFEGAAEGRRLIKEDSNYDGWTISMILSKVSVCLMYSDEDHSMWPKCQ